MGIVGMMSLNEGEISKTRCRVKGRFKSLIDCLSLKKRTGREGVVVLCVLTMWGILGCLVSPHAEAGASNVSDSDISTIVVVGITSLPSFAITFYEDFSDATSSSLSEPDRKVVLQARDDALSFVATQGVHRGSFLEAALEVLAPVRGARSDMELALAIIGSL